MYKKIDIFVNGEYICSTRKYRTARELVQRIRAEKKIFVSGSPDRLIYVCDYDKLKAVYSE